MSNVLLKRHFLRKSSPDWLIHPCISGEAVFLTSHFTYHLSSHHPVGSTWAGLDLFCSLMYIQSLLQCLAWVGIQHTFAYQWVNICLCSFLALLCLCDSPQLPTFFLGYYDGKKTIFPPLFLVQMVTFRLSPSSAVSWILQHYYSIPVAFMFNCFISNSMWLQLYLGCYFLLLCRPALHIFRAARIRQLLQPRLTAPLSPAHCPLWSLTVHTAPREKFISNGTCCENLRRGAWETD